MPFGYASLVDKSTNLNFLSVLVTGHNGQGRTSLRDKHLRAGSMRYHRLSRP